MVFRRTVRITKVHLASRQNEFLQKQKSVLVSTPEKVLF